METSPATLPFSLCINVFESLDTSILGLGVSSWSARLMCDKSIPASDDTYVHDAELRKDFIKVSNVLKLFPVTASTTSDAQKTFDTVMEVLRALMEDACRRKGLLKTRPKPVDWIGLYGKMKPELERKERVKVD